MSDMRALLILGGPAAWALLAYLAAFFAVGIYGHVSALIRRAA